MAGRGLPALPWNACQPGRRLRIYHSDSLIIFWRVQVQRQTGVVEGALGNGAGRLFQKIVQGVRVGLLHLFKGATGKENRMPAMAVEHRLANRFGMVAMKRQQFTQGFRSQVRLVAQHDGPRIQSASPTIPIRRAHDGTEHAAFGLRIFNAMRRREFQPGQFHGKPCIIGPMDDGDLFGTEGLPLMDDMANDARVTPGQ